MHEVFPLDEILSVSTGYLLTERGMDAMYELIGHLTGDQGVTTLGIVAAMKSCAAELKRQYPVLENVGVPPWANSDRKVGSDEIRDWVREQESVVGGSALSVLGYLVYTRDYSFMNR